MIPHLKIGMDTSLNNKGSKFQIRRQVGLEIEQCVTLMRTLKWTYEFVQYDNAIGHVAENGTATGMLGDIQNGRLDMACGRFRMTADRAHILTFTYPTQFEVNQVYLIGNPQRSEDVGFLFRPFSSVVWMLIMMSILVVSLMFFILRVVEFRSSKEQILECLRKSLSQVLLSTFNVDISVHPKSTFFAFHVLFRLFTADSLLQTRRLFSAVWLLAWFHVFIDYYTSELSGMMVVSAKKQMPFNDFYGLLEHLRKGTYRLFTTSSDRIPECPREIRTQKCAQLFTEILSKHPPEFGDLNLLNNHDFLVAQKVPLVGFGWYPTQRVPSKFSIWTQELFHSNVWLIKDFPVRPAAYIVRNNFPYLDELNKAIIQMLPAFSTMDNHYTPSYPVISLFEKPSKSSFTLNQLSSIFFIHLSGTVFATILLIAEILMGKYHRHDSVSDQTIPTHAASSSISKQEYAV